MLVTGSSGFIGSHIVDQLLLAGYTVRGTVRSEKQVVSSQALNSRSRISSNTCFQKHAAWKHPQYSDPPHISHGAVDQEYTNHFLSYRHGPQNCSPNDMDQENTLPLLLPIWLYQMHLTMQ